MVTGTLVSTTKVLLTKVELLGGSPGLVVMEGDLCAEGMCLNPSAVYWMDRTFFHTLLVRIVLFV